MIWNRILLLRDCIINSRQTNITNISHCRSNQLLLYSCRNFNILFICGVAWTRKLKTYSYVSPHHKLLNKLVYGFTSLSFIFCPLPLTHKEIIILSSNNNNGVIIVIIITIGISGMSISLTIMATEMLTIMATTTTTPYDATRYEYKWHVLWNCLFEREIHETDF